MLHHVQSRKRHQKTVTSAAVVPLVENSTRPVSPCAAASWQSRIGFCGLRICPGDLRDGMSQWDFLVALGILDDFGWFWDIYSIFWINFWCALLILFLFRVASAVFRHRSSSFLEVKPQVLPCFCLCAANEVLPLKVHHVEIVHVNMYSTSRRNQPQLQLFQTVHGKNSTLTWSSHKLRRYQKCSAVKAWVLNGMLQGGHNGSKSFKTSPSKAALMTLSTDSSP